MAAGFGSKAKEAKALPSFSRCPRQWRRRGQLRVQSLACKARVEPRTRVMNSSFKLERKEQLIVKGNKILIIEDDADLRRALNVRLRASEAETALAPDASMALASAET